MPPTQEEMMANMAGYLRHFASREEALEHAVEMTLQADEPLAYVAVHGPEEGTFAVVDRETALDLSDDDIERVRLR